MNKLMVTRDLYNIASYSEEEPGIAFTVNEPEGEMIAMRSPVGDCIDVNNDGHYVVQKSYWQDLVDIMNSNGYELLHNEANVTANVAGYQTPYAFGKASDKQIEALGYKKVKKTNRHFKPMENKKSQYKRMVSEIYHIDESYRDFKNDDTMTNEQKINKSIREVNKMLAEVEKLVHNSYKLKVETGFQSDRFWKRSRAAFGKISERMNRISNKIKELGQ